MNFTTFVRKPFMVQAVEITADNIEELARFIGDLEEKEDHTPYILVDRRKVPNVARVYIGFWMTKMGDNVRVYSKKIFNEQFVADDPEIQSWVKFLNGESDEPEVEITDDTAMLGGEVVEEWNRR